MKLNEIKDKSASLNPIVRIGKSGLTGSVIEEIKKHLKMKDVIKVKMLKSFIANGDKKMLAKSIAERTGSILVHRVGFVIVLARKEQ